MKYSRQFSEGGNTNIGTSSNAILLWLVICAVLLFLEVALGAIARFLHSDLYIGYVNIAKNVFPPSTDEQWNKLFYEFESSLQRADFYVLFSDFKSLFYFDYFHKLFGFLLIAVYLLPLFAFLIRKQLSRRLAKYYISVAIVYIFLGYHGLQALYGADYNLTNYPVIGMAIHVEIAALIFGALTWALTDIAISDTLEMDSVDIRIQNLAYTLIVLTLVTILLGSITVGLKDSVAHSS